MIFALFLLVLCALLSALGVIYYVYWRIRRAYAGVIRSYMDYITPGADNAPSHLEQAIDYVAACLARRLINTVTAQDRQSASVDARMMRNIERDIAADNLAVANPVLGVILDQMPTLKRRLLRNPRYIDAALPLIMRALQSAPGGEPAERSPGNSGHRDIYGDIADRIRRDSV